MKRYWADSASGVGLTQASNVKFGVSRLGASATVTEPVPSNWKARLTSPGP